MVQTNVLAMAFKFLSLPIRSFLWHQALKSHFHTGTWEFEFTVSNRITTKSLNVKFKTDTSDLLLKALGIIYK